MIKQIDDVGLKNPELYLSFLGTLFLFVAMACLCTIIPGYEPPTGSLSTTVALAHRACSWQCRFSASWIKALVAT